MICSRYFAIFIDNFSQYRHVFRMFVTIFEVRCRFLFAGTVALILAVMRLSNQLSEGMLEFEQYLKQTVLSDSKHL